MELGIYYKNKNFYNVFKKVIIVDYWSTFYLALILSFYMISFLISNYEKFFKLIYLAPFLFIFIGVTAFFFYVFTYGGSRINDTITRMVNIILVSSILTLSIEYLIVGNIIILKILFMICFTLFIGFNCIKKVFENYKHFWLLAVHESSHAVISEMEFPNSVTDITIKKKKSQFSGLTTSNFDNKNNYELYLKQIRIFLAGELGEKLFLDYYINQEPIGDIELINETLKDIINNGHIHKYKNKKWDELNSIDQQRFYNDTTKSQHKIIKNMLVNNKEVIIQIAHLLRKNKIVYGDEIKGILNNSNVM